MKKKIKVPTPSSEGTLCREATEERKASTAESEDQGSTPNPVTDCVTSDKGFNLVVPRLYSSICEVGTQMLRLRSVMRSK